VRFDWLSFVIGFLAATIILSAWQKRVDRLRWKTLRMAISAGISLEQYAKDLEDAETGKWKR
jgi:hypothetical protein